jgi:hypothetical protein
MNKAICQGESHGSVVCPLTRFKVEGATADDLRQWRVAVSLGKLESRAKRVTNGKTQQSAKSPVPLLMDAGARDRLGDGT